MASIWPWLAVAGLGALHGLNPATGWLLAAAWGLRARDRTRALRALVPLAIGHLVSIAIVAAAVAFGFSMDRSVLQILAGALIAVLAVAHVACHRFGLHMPTGQAGLALWSFMVATGQGAGLMLVPALIPICIGDASRRLTDTSEPLLLAFMGVAVHTVAMLVVTGLVAHGVCRGVDAGPRLFGYFRRPSRGHLPSERTAGE